MVNGFIYCLSNPGMPELLKIGKTQRTAEIRSAELFDKNTSVPAPFKVEYKISVANVDEREKEIHKLLDEYRFSNNYSSGSSGKREFFKVSLEMAKTVINRVASQHIIEYNPADEPVYMKKYTSVSKMLFKFSKYMQDNKYFEDDYDNTNELQCKELLSLFNEAKDGIKIRNVNHCFLKEDDEYIEESLDIIKKRIKYLTKKVQEITKSDNEESIESQSDPTDVYISN